MTILTKTTAKTFFETADIPTGGNFANWIDSCVFIPANVTAGSFPFLIEVESTTNSTIRTIGAVGAQTLNAVSTASIASLLELVTAASFGATLLSAASQGSALSILGIVGVGRQVAQATATATAQNALGIGSVGRAIFEAATTAPIISLIAAAKTPVTSISVGAGEALDVDISGFSAYQLMIDRMVPSTAGPRLNLLFRRRGATVFDDAAAQYVWTIEEIHASANTAAVTSDSSDPTIRLLWGIHGDRPSTAAGFSGALWIYGANNTALQTNAQFDGQFLGVVTAAPSAFTHVAARAYGTHVTAVSVDRMRLMFVIGAGGGSTSQSIAINARLFGYA